MTPASRVHQALKDLRTLRSAPWDKHYYVMFSGVLDDDAPPRVTRQEMVISGGTRRGRYASALCTIREAEQDPRTVFLVIYCRRLLRPGTFRIAYEL